jgi:hypothetical protein
MQSPESWLYLSMCFTACSVRSSALRSLILPTKNSKEMRSKKHKGSTWLTSEQSIAEAGRAGVTIFTVSTADHLRAETDADQILQVLADRSGGESMFPGDMQTLESSLHRLRDLIRRPYLVVYKPAGLEANGKFRPVRVTAERKGERLSVHVRKGYNARLEARLN